MAMARSDQDDDDDRFNPDIQHLGQLLEDSSLTATAKTDTLLKRASLYESKGDYERALRDIRTCLSIDKSNADALEAAQKLVRLTAEKSSSSPLASISNMLLIAAAHSTSDSSIGDSQRNEVVQRLIILSHDSSGALSIGKHGGVELLMPIIMTLPPSSLRPKLIVMLSNLSQVPELASRILSYIDSSSVKLLLASSDDNAEKLAADLLGRCVLKCLPQLKSQAGLRESAIIAVEALSNLASDTTKDEQSRLAGIKGLITAIGDEDAAMLYLHSEDFSDLLGCVGDKHDSIKQLIALAVARFIDNTSTKQEDGISERLYRLVANWVDSDKKGEKAQGLLALSAIFQARPSIGSSILLKQGFVENLMEVIEFEGEDVQLATVETLSSSCTDKACRALVASRCAAFLLTLTSHHNAALRTAASICLIKCMFADKELEKRMLQQADKSVSDFGSVIQSTGTNVDESLKVNAVEALAFLSTHGIVKERIAKDGSLLAALFKLASWTDKKAVQYGIASIIANLTAFRRRATAEEQQILKLRAMAERQPEPTVDPLDDNSVVEKRCALVAKTGGVNALVTLSKGASPALREMAAQAFLSIATDKNLRGLVVQQGGVKCLVSLASEGTPESIAHAAQALAKVAITSDPNVAFSGQRAAELVRPLVTLCGSESELCQFEGLMALTNLASMDDNIRGRIVAAKGVSVMETLQFSDNIMIRRTATEALCNMMFEPSVFTAYATATSSSKLRMLVALSDAEDFETRRAASGALAILSQHPNACRNINVEGRGPEIAASTLEPDVEVDVQLRGIEIVKNMAAAGPEVAKKLIAHGALGKLKRLLASDNQGVALGAAATLNALKEAGIE
ncbi:hypothetical protein SeMB42_g03247 [Synchytrium endobioticum]|uniref:UNC-45/Cro1/She4 central domain-containing protein n=1 Tax=Synchytrium endobioticum TaxID=286115 RepID=A0A507D8D7_9FUNG|nr:hypothetical protein SeLEV6574_g04910 [Synchytrium endobioticum]TPX47681.1 hypothetical protein SeMB42_g03247 [Synchytrium endobioticum]